MFFSPIMSLLAGFTTPCHAELPLVVFNHQYSTDGLPQNCGRVLFQDREVAEKAGYSSAAHFSKAFKQYTGYSPSEWRREEGDETHRA